MKLATYLIFGLLIITGLGMTSAQSTITPSLFGTRWQLLSYGAPDSQIPAVADANVTIEFGMGATASGFGGCNSYSINYTGDEPNIRFDMPMSTLMACLRDEVMNQELFFLQTLQAVSTYEVRDNMLILNYDGGQMIFMALKLEDTTWELVRYGDMNNSTAPVGDTPITAQFGKDGTVTGSTGCNSYGGNYVIGTLPEANKVSFTDVYQTEMACMGDGVMAQESAYLNALATATGIISQNAERLIIGYGDNHQLMFERRYTLENTSWKLVAQSAQSVPSAVQGDLTLEFGADMGASGSGGCNRYNTQYTLTGSQISFTAVASTRMACADAVMSQEMAFFSALESANHILIADDTLIVYTDNTTVLTFERIPNA